MDRGQTSLSSCLHQSGLSFASVRNPIVTTYGKEDNLLARVNQTGGQAGMKLVSGMPGTRGWKATGTFFLPSLTSTSLHMLVFFFFSPTEDELFPNIRDITISISRFGT